MTMWDLVKSEPLDKFIARCRRLLGECRVGNEWHPSEWEAVDLAFALDDAVERLEAMWRLKSGRTEDGREKH